MNFLEAITWIGILLLALYGCAHLIRRICLWLTRCDRSVTFYRLAIPPQGMAIEPLCRCLQAQTAWQADDCTQTVLLVSADCKVTDRLLTENPAVLPLTEQELTEFISSLY